MLRAALTLSLLTACGSKAPPLVMALGTSDAVGAGFYPLAGDQTMVAGTQGGFHVWLKLRVSGRFPGQVWIDSSTRRADDNTLILQYAWQEDIAAPGPDGYWELATPRPAFLCPPPPGVRVQDQTVRFVVIVRDRADKAALSEADAEATPHCPTTDPEEHDLCVRICNG
jgi:hypothetical protein